MWTLDKRITHELPLLTMTVFSVLQRQGLQLLLRSVQKTSIHSKMSHKRRTTKTTKSGGTVVLTSTPSKDQLVEEQKKMIEQEEKKSLKMSNKQTLKYQIKHTKPHLTMNRGRKRKEQVEEDEEWKWKTTRSVSFVLNSFYNLLQEKDGCNASNAKAGYKMRVRELMTMTMIHTAAITAMIIN